MPDQKQGRKWLTREQALQIACDACMNRGVRVVAADATIKWRLWIYRIELPAEEGQADQLHEGGTLSSVCLSLNRMTGKIRSMELWGKYYAPLTNTSEEEQGR